MNKNKQYIIKAILIGFLITLVTFGFFETYKLKNSQENTSGGDIQEVEIVPDVFIPVFDFKDITFNPQEHLKYEIVIDCKWVGEHLNDTAEFPDEVRELCEEFFPEVMSKFTQNKLKVKTSSKSGAVIEDEK